MFDPAGCRPGRDARPGAFSEFTGQLKVKERLDIAVQAAKQRGDSLDHILLSGPPGLGKSTPLEFFARDGGELKVTSGPTIEKAPTSPVC